MSRQQSVAVLSEGNRRCEYEVEQIFAELSRAYGSTIIYRAFKDFVESKPDHNRYQQLLWHRYDELLVKYGAHAVLSAFEEIVYGDRAWTG